MPASSARILIIDDDEFVRNSLESVLSHHGYAIVLAQSGPEGLELLERGNFQLVITDLLMPEIDGIEIIRHIRQRDTAQNILAISGGDHTTHVHHLRAAQALGATDVLKKPFDEDTLLKAVRLLLAT